ncbi:DNA polymerase III subunit chi [Thiorhodovibrio winogradskyi]|uniref:DNA polymerase III subunit chi n=1 Tax=Thiorhodovibrio winogradskyi TaxID=77007 RepID=A0ABZ0S6U9_9GAMM|nr:DNA polymerase III subunit chi [Thiorhodovibrio winogradskyi]
MTRVDFYSLEPSFRGNRFDFACRLIEKIRTQGLRVLVHCPDIAQARALDRLLWTFRDEAFVPHGLVGQVDAEWTPVLISPNGEPVVENQVLINLAQEVPDFFSRFQRVCELIDQAPRVLTAGRQRWAWYKQQSVRLEHHRIGG